ncbi:MAG: YlxR family protein [Acidimicrobiia bacterium]|nr:YlxR family protein [Acidimicrobiia bacterium]MDH5238738.1 YlxR family protein [Acidimicrobiia bacterium]
MTAVQIPPERTCIACRQARPAGDLVRLTRNAEGSVLVGRRLPGRGAWLGPHRACLLEAINSRAFLRAFRATVEPAALDGVLEHWSGPDDPPTWCPLA